MRTYILGDVHGGFRALMQVLELSKFNYEEDRLICLGDIVDGWPESMECIDELLKIKHLVYIWGNHDEWYYKFLKFGQTPYIWTSQGGQATIDSYIKKIENENTDFIEKHLELFNNAHYYYIDEERNLYVHGGFDWHKPIEENDSFDLMWDRHAFGTACMWEAFKLAHPTHKPNYFKDYNEIFVGHTCTNHGIDYRIGNTLEPLNVANMWNLDQGAGWDGKLSLMDRNTKEYWQSDIVLGSYPGHRGRN